MEDKIKKYFPFEKFRPKQRESIEAIIKTYQTKPYFVLEAPTGIGKSGIAYCVSQFAINDVVYKNKPEGPPVIICTSTRMLQKQYSDTFKDVKTLWSSRHYDCPLDPGSANEDEEPTNYGSLMCPKNKCTYFKICPYLIAKTKFMKSKIGVLNYHFFLSKEDLNPNLLICDEAHNLENILCEIMALEITSFSVERIYKNLRKFEYITKDEEEVKLLVDEILNIKDIKPLSKDLDILEALIEELDHICMEISERIEEIKEFVDEYGSQVPKKIRKEGAVLEKIYNDCIRLSAKINYFLNSKVEWVIAVKDEKHIKFKPLSITDISRNFLNRSTNLLFMSSTICGATQFCKELGIDDNSTYDYLSLPSIFPKENRMIYSINLGVLNYKNQEELLPKFIENIDVLIQKMIDGKGPIRGLIHSVSYKNAEKILKLSKFKDRMLIPNSYEVMNINDILSEAEDIILVSPRITEGVDLHDDLSRFQFFPKVPYPYLGDAWIKGKLERDPDWYSRETIIKLVQGAGRSVRSEEDWAYTFILDSNFRRLVTINRNMFPTWFIESVKFINVNSV